MARMKAEARRRQLLEVAAELFARTGYDGTTTAALAEAAGITEPILYRHFDSKLDLFVTLLRELGQEVLTAWRRELDDVDEPGDRLRVLLAGNPATHQRGQGIYRVIFQAMTDANADPRVETALREHVAELHAFLRDEITSLQKRDAVRTDETASDLAWLLISIATGYGVLAPSETARSKAISKRAMQTLLADLLQGR